MTSLPAALATAGLVINQESKSVRSAELRHVVAPCSKSSTGASLSCQLRSPACHAISIRRLSTYSSKGGSYKDAASCSWVLFASFCPKQDGTAAAHGRGLPAKLCGIGQRSRVRVVLVTSPAPQCHLESVDQPTRPSGTFQKSAAPHLDPKY